MPPIRHKFNAKPCESDGLKFPSKAERAYYEKLKLLKASGEVLFFLRQVPFDLPGNTVYRADFMVFYADGSAKVVDVKGMRTPVFELKKKLLEETYPISLELVK